MEKLYKTHLYDVGNNKPEIAIKFRETSVRNLREIYVKTSFYSPFSKDIIDEISGHAFIMDTSNDAKKVSKATRDYKDLFDKHIVNYDVLLACIKNESF